MIRYVLLNALKLQIANLIVFKMSIESSSISSGEIFGAVIILVAVCIAFITFTYSLIRLQTKLALDVNVKKFGTLYAGKNVKNEEHCVYNYPPCLLLSPRSLRNSIDLPIRVSLVTDYRASPAHHGDYMHLR